MTIPLVAYIRSKKDLSGINFICRYRHRIGERYLKFVLLSRLISAHSRIISRRSAPVSEAKVSVLQFRRYAYMQVAEGADKWPTLDGTRCDDITRFDMVSTQFMLLTSKTALCFVGGGMSSPCRSTAIR